MRQPDLEETDRDAEWLTRIRGSDRGAFDALFLAYHDPLVRFAYGYLKRSSAAEEIVQDVFFNIWVHREQWEVQNSVRTYLYTAVRNRAFNVLSRGAREEQWVASVGDREDAPTMLPRVAPADERAELAELDAAIQRAIDRLPPRCRETFVLSRRHHLSHEQIASVMGLSVKTVQEQIGRALRALRVSLAAWLE